jgi:hypothetical protein
MSKIEEGSISKTFGAVLAEVSRFPNAQDDASDPLDCMAGVSPMAGVSLPIGDDSPPVLGGAANWDAGMSWIERDAVLADEPENDWSPEDDSTPEDGLREAIALELGVARASTVEQLDQARREFMWRHHPDRFAGPRRASATRRASIANNLLDEARSRLTTRS